MYVLLYQKEKIISFVAISLVSILLYSPWLVVLFDQLSVVSNDFWIAPITLKSIASYGNLFLSTQNILVDFLLCIIFAFVFFSYLLAKKKTKKDYFIISLLLCVILLIVVGLGISYLVRPLLIARFLIPVFTLFWMYFAVGFSRIHSLKIQCLVFSSLVLICLMSWYLAIRSEYQDKKTSEQFCAYISAHIQPTDTIITNDVHLIKIMDYLFEDNEFITIHDLSLHDDRAIISALLTKPELFDSRRIWVFMRHLTWSKIPRLTLRDYIGEFKYNRYEFDIYFIERLLDEHKRVVSPRSEMIRFGD